VAFSFIISYITRVNRPKLQILLVEIPYGESRLRRWRLGQQIAVDTEDSRYIVSRRRRRRRRRRTS
jgi:hypothetical protein